MDFRQRLTFDTHVMPKRQAGMSLIAIAAWIFAVAVFAVLAWKVATA